MFNRIKILIIVFSFLSFSIIGRIGFINISKNYSVEKSYNSYAINVDNLYSNFYYADSNKINNNTRRLVAIIEPNEKCIGELDYLFENNQKLSIIDELKKGKPVIKEIDNYVKLKYIKIQEIKGTENNCNQLISKSSNGLLNHCPKNIGSLKYSYNIDAKGRILNSKNNEIINENYNSKEGYKLTIDESLQELLYDACKDLDNGCAIILDNNFEIKAIVTRPNDSFLNKPFMQYNPGSVFKIIVAIAALENNINLNYECNGHIKIGDTTFSCQNEKPHGRQDLKEALSNSCNCYFVNLALNLGYKKLADVANKLGFNDETNIFDDWTIKNGFFPNKDDINSLGELALMGFGQGKITVSPLQMAKCIAIIANNGVAKDVTLVKSRVNRFGQELKFPQKEFYRLLDSKICNTMIDYLSYVVTDGTGKLAQSNNNSSAGKTATAQTGQYSNDKEILTTWFVGLYPKNEPKYSIVIMKENGTSGSKDCCPIFRTIVDNIDKK